MFAPVGVVLERRNLKGGECCFCAVAFRLDDVLVRFFVVLRASRCIIWISSRISFHRLSRRFSYPEFMLRRRPFVPRQSVCSESVHSRSGPFFSWSLSNESRVYLRCVRSFRGGGLAVNSGLYPVMCRSESDSLLFMYFKANCVLFESFFLLISPSFRLWWFLVNAAIAAS